MTRGLIFFFNLMLLRWNHMQRNSDGKISEYESCMRLQDLPFFAAKAMQAFLDCINQRQSEDRSL